MRGRLESPGVSGGHERREMSFATMFGSQAPVFFARDRSRGMTEWNKAFELQLGTTFPAKSMLERLQEAYFI